MRTRSVPRGSTLAFAIVFALVGATPTLAKDEAPLDLTTVFAQLSGDDAKARKAAGTTIAKMDVTAVPSLIRPAVKMGDGTGREALLAALKRLGPDDVLAAIVASRSEWPENTEEVERLIEEIRALRKVKPTKVTLKRTVLKEPRRIPPDAELPVDGAIPFALAGAVCAVEEKGGRLQVDTDGDGKFDAKVDPAKPKPLKVGPRNARRTILVHWRLDRWYAGAAELAVGKYKGSTIEILDTDLSRSFDGDIDVIAVDGGAFRPHRIGEFLHTKNGPVRYEIEQTRKKTTMFITPEPRPKSADKGMLRAVDTLNAWRNAVGMPPVNIDLPRSASCRKHADYWKEHGFTGHDETVGEKAYTKDGALAGLRSSVSSDADPARVMDHITATILHRITCIGSSDEGVGVASGPGSVLWGGRVDTTSRTLPVLVPAPGQVDVPLALRPEMPLPERDAGYYSVPHGYPISVSFRGLWEDVSDSLLVIYEEDDPKKAIPGQLFSAEFPYRSTNTHPGTTAFCADEPLTKDTWYVAHFTAMSGAAKIDFTWTFRTQ